MFYFHFHDIQISAQRKKKSLSLAVTVQNIQLDNQLKEPVYRVAMYPRDHNQMGSAQLLLPGNVHAIRNILIAILSDHNVLIIISCTGLHQKLDVFPSLH